MNDKKNEFKYFLIKNSGLIDAIESRNHHFINLLLDSIRLLTAEQQITLLDEFKKSQKIGRTKFHQSHQSGLELVTNFETKTRQLPSPIEQYSLFSSEETPSRLAKKYEAALEPHTP